MERIEGTKVTTYVISYRPIGPGSDHGHAVIGYVRKVRMSWWQRAKAKWVLAATLMLSLLSRGVGLRQVSHTDSVTDAPPAGTGAGAADEVEYVNEQRRPGTASRPSLPSLCRSASLAQANHNDTLIEARPTGMSPCAVLRAPFKNAMDGGERQL